MFVECGTGYEGLGFAVDIVGGKIPKTLLFVFFSPLEGKKSTCKFWNKIPARFFRQNSFVYDPLGFTLGSLPPNPKTVLVCIVYLGIKYSQYSNE